MLRTTLLRGFQAVGVRCMNTVPRGISGFSRITVPSAFSRIPMLNPIVNKVEINDSILNKIDICFEPVVEEKVMHADSVLRKRRLKMKKHKLRKRRREQRSLMKRLGKI